MILAERKGNKAVKPIKNAFNVGSKNSNETIVYIIFCIVS